MRWTLSRRYRRKHQRRYVGNFNPCMNEIPSTDSIDIWLIFRFIDTHNHTSYLYAT